MAKAMDRHKKLVNIAQAKARLSQLVEEAMRGQPQLVISRGRKAVVVLDWETYSRHTRADLSLWQALRRPKPLPNEEAEALFARVEAEPQEVSLL